VSYLRTALLGVTIGLLLRAAPVGAGNEVPWVYDLNRPVVLLPAAMARDAVTVWYQCEVRTEVMTPYSVPGEARNPSGATGTPQLMPLHAPGMAKRGLDFSDDGDRIRYAIQMWLRSGWGPWSCKP